MSHEFYQILVGAPTMSLYSWKQLARWSVDYSCLSIEQRKKAHEILHREWHAFCQKVVDEYGYLVSEGGFDDEQAKDAFAKLKTCALHD